MKVFMRFFSCFFILSSLSIAAAQATPFVSDASYQTCFTPETSHFTMSCTNQIVEAIHVAQKEILVQAYSFTSMPIAKALVEAKQRGVDVKVILDKSQKSIRQRFSSAQFFRDYGIPVWIDSKVAIAHNKVMVIDKKTVIEGSFNFTKAAEEHNAENVNIITDSNFAKLYITNWYNRQAVSTPFNPDQPPLVTVTPTSFAPSAHALHRAVHHFLR